MRLIPGTTIKMVEQCSGHDGTWAMKKSSFALDAGGEKGLRWHALADAEVWASDCPLASIQIGRPRERGPSIRFRCWREPIERTVFRRRWRRRRNESGRAGPDQEHRRVRTGTQDLAPPDDGVEGPARVRWAGTLRSCSRTARRCATDQEMLRIERIVEPRPCGTSWIPTTS